ncbi:MAG: DUF4252 domain-containing protein [Bacteroidales bacterium]|nr:DUF4252 domain-containing protein [Bacteroidales bacterium]
MKRLIILMTFILLPMAMSAQISSFFERYNGQQGYQSIVYGKRMLDMMKDNASPDVKSLLDRISSIRIISCDRQDDHIVGIARRNVVGDDYEVISQIKEDGSSSYFYIKEKGRKSKDVSFVMIVSGPKGSAVMEIVGEFDVKDISKLSVIGQK